MAGAAEKTWLPEALPKTVAIQPTDFRGLKPRLVVRVDDHVKVGSPVLCDKQIEGLKVVSPVSGRVAAINRGAKRALLSIVIESDGLQDHALFRAVKPEEIASLTYQDTVQILLDGGLWPVVRQRPFSKIADPAHKPKSIFIHAMTTEPLAPDLDFILDDQKEDFQTGLNILRRLTDGPVHLCIARDSQSKALREAKGVEIQEFAGPHPAGNVSTHIYHVDPLNKGEIVWYIEAQDVPRVAHLFLKGAYTGQRVVAVTGDGAVKRGYARTLVGAQIKPLLGDSSLEGQRCLSGSVLTGANAGADGFLRFYDAQITVIPEGGRREFLGWLKPGADKYTFSKAFVSAFLPEREVSLDTDENGSHRAIVMNHIYDEYIPLDIMVYFLVRAVLSENIEEAEALGILECDEEDFALCSFACPSKVNVGAIIRQGLDLIEKEG